MISARHRALAISSNADKSSSPMTWRRCCGHGAGALQMATGRQSLVAAGLGGTLEAPNFILIAPHDGTIRIFLALGFVDLLEVVGVAFEYDASLFCV